MSLAVCHMVSTTSSGTLAYWVGFERQFSSMYGFYSAHRIAFDTRNLY
jgi:hypothetical protein